MVINWTGNGNPSLTYVLMLL